MLDREIGGSAQGRTDKTQVGSRKTCLGNWVAKASRNLSQACPLSGSQDGDSL